VDASTRVTPASRQVGAMTLTLKSDLEVEITRVFNAPRRLVFEAHTKPEHMQRWWGPRNTTMVGCEMDFRAGGSYRYVLRKAGGQQYAFRGEYREVVAPERIVQTFEFEGMPGAAIEETLTFTEHEGRTTLTVTSKANSIAVRDGLVHSGMEKGAAETYDRLEEHLGSLN
jgi:uncharacterized protein YndB with AHSA1/START domain